jgi:hypothetical protein
MTADLFGFESQTTRRTNNRPEAAALAEVLRVLRHHPAVAWVERQNSGVARMGGRFVRFGWPGCSDLIGMMQDGRLLAVECKAPAGQVRAEQAEFLALVRRFGGVAFVARDCRDVLRELPGIGGGSTVHRNAPATLAKG